jgi:hypothetical protein
MPNPFVDASRDDRWETGLPELSMQQLRAPAALRWLKHDAKPADVALGTFALTSMFDVTLIRLIIAKQYREVIGRLVSTWPELLTEVRDDLTVVSEADGRQRKPLTKAGAR